MSEATQSSRDVNRLTWHDLGRVTLVACVVAFSALTLAAAVKSVIPVRGSVFNAYGTLVGGDFIVFYAAAKTALGGDFALIYDAPHLFQLQDAIAGDKTEGMPFVYPPVALLLWVPFATQAYVPAFYVWMLTTVGCLAAVTHRIGRSWVVSALIVMSPLVLRAATTGQSGNLAAVLIGIACLGLQKHPLAAGAALGCLVFKPHLAIMVPVCLAAGRHWRAFWACGTTAGLLVVTSVLLFGVEAWLDCVHSAGAFADHYFSDLGNMWHRVPTVHNAVNRLTGSEQISWVVQIGVAACTVILTAKVWSQSGDVMARSLSLAAATFLVSPKALMYDTAIFAIPLAYLLVGWRQGRIGLGACVLTICLWGLPLFGEVARAWGWQPSPLLFLVALGYACQRAFAPVSSHAGTATIRFGCRA